MDQHRKAALEIIHEYYYALPNNGYLNHGLLSCDKRYKEATQCALIGVKRIILILEFMSMEPNSAFVMDRINFYDKVEGELYQMQADNSNQLPTAKEFLNRDESGVFNEVDITQAMDEYAKLHVERIKQFLYGEICERRDYSASKMCEEVIKFIDNNEQ
jgi:hypothetical protein